MGIVKGYNALLRAIGLEQQTQHCVAGTLGVSTDDIMRAKHGEQLILHSPDPLSYSQTSSVVQLKKGQTAVYRCNLKNYPLVIATVNNSYSEGEYVTVRAIGWIEEIYYVATEDCSVVFVCQDGVSESDLYTIKQSVMSKLLSAEDKSNEILAAIASIKVGMVVKVQTETAGLLLESGTTSVWGTPIDSLSFNLLPPTNGTEAHYRLRFQVGTPSVPFIDAPALIGEMPEWTAGVFYEMDIISADGQNYVIVKSWEE